MVLARAFSQLGGALIVGAPATFSISGSGNTNLMVFPSPIDSGFLLTTATPIIEAVAGGWAVRGFVPGYLQILGQWAIQHHQILEPVVSLPGRKILGLAPTTSVGGGRIGIDLTGPWRQQ